MNLSEIQSYLAYIQPLNWSKQKEAEQITNPEDFKVFFSKYHSPCLIDILYNPNSDCVLLLNSNENWVLYTIEWRLKHPF